MQIYRRDNSDAILSATVIAAMLEVYYVSVV